jgi:hypothetical protein
VVVIVPLVAIVLGLLALREIDRDPVGTDGRGLAIGGVVLGLVGLLIGAVFVVLLVTDSSTTSGSGIVIGDVFSAPADDFAVGTCTQRPDTVTYANLASMDCGIPHGGEIYFRGDVGPSYPTYPGDDAIFDAADAMCLPAFGRYVGSSYEESILDVYYFAPDERSWALGDREVVCIAMSSDGFDLPAGSVEGSGI